MVTHPETRKWDHHVQVLNFQNTLLIALVSPKAKPYSSVLAREQELVYRRGENGELQGN